MPAFFGQLITATDEDRRAFETHPKVIDAVANGMTVERYRKFLLELYHVVWHFNPVCANAASRLPDTWASVRMFLYEHMHEEAGHEQWVLNDLEAVGVGRDVAQAHAPSAYTLALNGFNYWAPERRHPCAVLGMLDALEVIASVYGSPFASAIRESLLLEGDRGVSFINSHGSLDAVHMAELRQVLNPLEGEEAQAAIIEAVRVNFHHFTHILAEV